MPCECEPGDVLPTTPCERQLLPWALGPRLTLVSQLFPEKEKCGALRQSERTCPPPHDASPAWCGPGVRCSSEPPELNRSSDPPKAPTPSRFCTDRAKLLEKL